ncbi:hypothetical protein B0H19DRAFT_1180566 [Mycena capillaripes]|nr:hypothetical protein B0H19DRAFT_1180566 [Mycena capillaripes]
MYAVNAGRTRRVFSVAPPAYDAHLPGANPQYTASAGPPPVPSNIPPNDRTPLLSQQESSDNREPQQPQAKWAALIVFFFFVFVIIITHVSAPTEEALDPAARERLRRQWDREIGGHEQMRRAWSEEVAQHEAIRAGWETERAELIAMREQLVRDRERWVGACDEGKREERKRAEEEADRVRAGFDWADLKSDQRCLRHGTREYSARITNVPRTYDPVQACTETAVEIQGSKIPSPNQCEDRGCSGVFGHWAFPSEPSCMTYFGDVADTGCTSTGSRRRRAEARLWSLQSGDDWRDMCFTTPVDFREMHFDGPDMCEHRGLYGVWGMWEFEDRNC